MKELIINNNWCKSCGICVEFCPKKVLQLKDDNLILISDDCILCGLCEIRCPDYAIYIQESN